jgi:hypothetical protein
MPNNVLQYRDSATETRHPIHLLIYFSEHGSSSDMQLTQGSELQRYVMSTKSALSAGKYILCLQESILVTSRAALSACGFLASTMDTRPPEHGLYHKRKMRERSSAPI